MSDERVSFAPGVDREAAIEQALTVLRREGVVVLDDLVDPALLARAKAEIEENEPDHARVDPVRNYGPYKGRHTAPMCVQGTLADRAIFLPKPIEKIAIEMLGNNFLVDSMGLLVSLPGAEDQRGHPDGTLFPEVRIEPMLPCFALAFSMPLVPMDEVSGRTAFWRRSHRTMEAKGEHDYAPVVAPGSAILWDFRTWHCGLANRGERTRPVIYSVFSRYWWVEIHPPVATKYEKFLIARDVYDQFPPKLQRRVGRAKLVDGDQLVSAYEVGCGAIGVDL